MIAIAAVDENWAIGYKGRLLYSIPDDMRFFRETTKGNTVVMGRKTLESFPGRKPLVNRTNIVLTRDTGYDACGAIVVHSKEELFEKIKDVPGDEVFVIGGASVYKELLGNCDRCLITKMYSSFEADAYYPCLDEMNEWTVTERSGVKKYEDLEYEFVTYERVRENS